MSRLPLGAAATLLAVQVVAQPTIDLRISRRYELNHLPGTTRAYAFGDVSGDGRKDVYISKGGGGADHLVLACPGGGFIRSAVDIKEIGYPSFDVQMVDVDVDGDLDVVTVAPRDMLSGCNTSRVLINVNGRGDLQPMQRLPEMTCGQALAVGDVDNNGFPDLFIGGEGGDPNMLLFNTDGYFAPIPGRLPGVRSEVVGAVMFDADGDLDPDIAMARADGVAVLINDKSFTGRFVELIPFCLPMSDQPTSAIAAGDVDGNGFADLVCASIDRGTVQRQCRIIKNFGGCFRDPEPLNQVTDDAHDVCVGDLDGDGDLDLAFACHALGQPLSPIILVNNGTGSFTRSTWTGRPVIGNAIAASDVDDDRDLDLWVGSQPMNNLGIDHWYAGYERQLDGPFNPQVGMPYQLNITAAVARSVPNTTALLFLGTGYIQPRLGIEGIECGGLGVFPIVAPSTIVIPSTGTYSLQTNWGGRGQLVFQALILPGGGLTGACFTNVVGDAI